MARKWKIAGLRGKDIIEFLLENRGLTTKKDREDFLHPRDPINLTPHDIGIDAKELRDALSRINRAIQKKESMVVYADYDADGITAGAIMWEALHGMGANIMPYIPHRVEEGYGLSVKGIDAVKEKYNPTLIITVDHGITAKEKVAYAKTLGIDVVVTDHHVKPNSLPDCPMVHTTMLCGAGISWFVAKELLNSKRSHLAGQGETLRKFHVELLALAAIGTIADMMPLVGPNRSIVKYGLEMLNKTKRVGLEALISDAGLEKGSLTPFDVSHVLAPRINAMGRLVHAMDALRLLCTKRVDKAMELAKVLGLINKERQQLTVDTTAHALQGVPLSPQGDALRKLIFVSHESYNQGVIGLVAGKLVEHYYRPAIVVSRGVEISKASARSISGFNIVEAIRSCSDILIDVGGHPMAAGFTVETRYLGDLKDRLEKMAEIELDEDKLTRTLKIDAEIPLELVSEKLWASMQDFQPFGFGNSEPVFATRGVGISDARLVGADGKHLKLRIIDKESRLMIDAIAFGMGGLFEKLRPDAPIDIAYSIDMNVWNGNRKLQLKIKDIQ
jgi:single-stranded-DNA-specific exonuclease